MSVVFDCQISGDFDFANILANFNAAVTCTPSGPAGIVSGEIDVTNGGIVTTYNFASSSPLSVNCRFAGPGIDAIFHGVQINVNSGAEVLFNGRVTFTGVKVSTDDWIGSLVLTLPDGRFIGVFGQWEGNVIVESQHFCSLI